MAQAPQDRFGEVRSLLARGADEQTFASVCDLWLKGQVPEAIVEYVRGVVNRWPEEVPCAVPEAWVEHVTGEGQNDPCPGLAMCKTLVLRGGRHSFAQEMGMWAKREELTGLHHLEIDGRYTSRNLPPVLFRSPTFARVERLVLKQVDGLGKSMDVFLNSALAQGLKRLHLEDVPLDPEQCERLVGAPNWSRLEDLTLVGCQLGTTLYTLCEREDLTHLRRLHFGKQTVSHHGVRAIAALAERTGALRKLEFERVSLSEVSVEVIATHRAFSSLEHLELSSCALSTASIKALVKSFTLSSLSSLNLSGNALGDDLTRALSHAPMCVGLTSLNLASCKLGPEGVEALSESLYLSNLTALELSYNALGDEAMIALAVSDALEGLRELGLRGCRLGDEGIVTLTQASFFDQLESLSLHDNEFRERGRYALWAKGRGLQGRHACLKHMTLTGEGLDEVQDLPEIDAPYALSIEYCQAELSFWDALTRSSRFRRLRKLEVEYSPWCEGAMEVISAWAVLARLERLVFRGTKLTTQALHALCDAVEGGRLEHLALKYEDLGDEDIEVLLDWEGLSRLRTLDLEGSMLPARLIDRLLDPTLTPCLKRLECMSNRAQNMAHHLKKRAAARGVTLDLEQHEVMMDVFPMEITRGRLAWSEEEEETF